MSMIEGVGDEVLVVVGLFALLCVVLLAWFSTHTRDIPFVSVIVVELSQRRQRSSNNGDGSMHNADEAVDGNEIDRVLSAGDSSIETAGINNNADTASDGAEDCGPASVSKNKVLVSGTSQSLPASETKSTDLQPPVTSESEAQDVSRQTAEGSGPVQAEAEAMMIPPYSPQREPGEEMRQRRVAYFSGGSGQGSCVVQKDVLSSGMHTAATMGESTVRDRTEVPASGQRPDNQSDGSHPTLSSETVVASSASQSSACPVVVSSSSAQLSEAPSTCPSDLSPPQRETLPSPERASRSKESAPEGSPSGSPVSGGALPPSGAVDGSPSRLAGEPPAGGTGAAEGLEDGASASGGVRERTGNRLSDTADTGGQQIRVRLKYLNDTQRLVYADPHETVGNFRRLHFSSELEDNKIIRFIFNGQDLRNDLSTLRAYNIIDNSVVHCLITQNQRAEAQAGAGGGVGQEEDNQMGALLFPVFGMILGLVWYLRFTYKQYFNAMSTVSLAGISFIYLLAFFSTVQHRRRLHPHME